MRDLIVAPATGSGPAALALVRASGAGIVERLARVVRPLRGALRPRRATRVVFGDQSGVFDDGLAIWYPGPRSSTGEDVLELTLHGNPLLVERLLAACRAQGVRLALPGEFTQRALEEGKLDLLQAEALDQLNRAVSPAGLEVARAGLDGRLGSALGALRDELLELTAELEARLDGPLDELVWMEDDTWVAATEALARRALALAETAVAGRLAVEGARVALTGPVNAGKSSLFNALLGQRRALVHAQPGTTRDVIEASLTLDGRRVLLLDTAGERETPDPVEALGQAMGQELAAKADLRLWVVPAGPAWPTVEPPPGALAVWNGVDRPSAREAPPGYLATSALTGQGLDQLRQALLDRLQGLEAGAAGLALASHRQEAALRAAGEALRQACAALPLAGPAVAAELCTLGLEHLDELAGRQVREDVLSALFRRFCIGK